MNNITIAFLTAAGVFLVAGVVMIFYKPREKDKTAKFDMEYIEKLHSIYLEKGSIEETFSALLDLYDDNKYMLSLLENAIAYLNGDYGDYETALKMMNPINDEELEMVSGEIIQMEIIKNRALPMKQS